MDQHGMALLKKERGLMARVAGALGLTRAAVVKWEQVPAERLLDIERITGIRREQLRPDLYEPAPEDKSGHAASDVTEPA